MKQLPKDFVGQASNAVLEKIKRKISGSTQVVTFWIEAEAASCKENASSLDH